LGINDTGYTDPVKFQEKSFKTKGKGRCLIHSWTIYNVLTPVKLDGQGF